MTLNIKMTRDKRLSLLILLTVFVCVLIFLFQKTSNHQNSNIKKHFVFELNTWKGNATCYPVKAFEDDPHNINILSSNRNKNIVFIHLFSIMWAQVVILAMQMKISGTVWVRTETGLWCLLTKGTMHC